MSKTTRPKITSTVISTVTCPDNSRSVQAGSLFRALLFMVLAANSANSHAVVWADVKADVVNNASDPCTNCHSYLNTNTVGPTNASDYRHSAPDNVNFDGASDLATYNGLVAASDYYGTSADDGTYGGPYGFTGGATAIDLRYEWAAAFVNNGYMPMDDNKDTSMPADGIIDDFADAADLGATEMATILNWALQGAPFAAPTATTDNNPTSITKTGATVQGDFNTNVHSGTAVPGTWYFEYGETTGYGSSSSVSNRSSTSTLSNTTKTLSSLSCGTTYHYRAVVTNGGYDDTNNSDAYSEPPVTGVDRTFTTSACTDPVMAGVTIVGNATSQTATEDANRNFSLTVTDDDPGSLQWSRTNGSNGGTVTLISPTSTAYSGSATVRYRSAANYYGADDFTVTVTNMNTGTSQTVTFNMTVNDDGTDSPTISALTSLSDDEDNSAGADATTSAISFSLSASDPDLSPTYHWDVTAINDGAPAFSVATGANPTFTYTPLQNDYGTPADSFTVRVCDGGAVGVGNCDTHSVTVNLTARPDSPTAVGEPTGLNILEGESNKLLTVIGNDIDPDSGEAATLIPVNVMVTSGDLGSVSVVGQQIQVSHGGAEETTASLSYQVRDTTSRTSSNTVTATISVTGTDDPPTGSDFTYGSTVNEASTVLIDVIAQSNDPENATMAVCSGTLSTPSYGTVSVVSGDVQYVHDGTDVIAATTDTDSFTYQVNDNNDATCATGNNSIAKTVSINLAAVNDPPQAFADSISVAEGGTATILVGGNTSVLQNDDDEENGLGTGLSVNGNTSPGFSAGFTLNSDGTFSYQHNGSENFNTSFDYTVNDGSTDSLTDGTVTIQVTTVNDPPAITSTAPTPVSVVLTEEAAANVYQITQTDPDDNNFSYSLQGTGLVGDTGAGDMAISAAGLITWTPPRTGVFDNATAAVTVRVTDSGSDTTYAINGSGNEYLPTQYVEQVFMVATSPLDSDGDGVADYSDNCPGDANAGQADLDNDTAYGPVDISGIPATGDVDPTATDGNGFLTGGDACDEDGDDDGMPNDFEDAYSFLDPLDASDASADEDGDGISNLDEYLSCDFVGDPASCDIVKNDSVGPSVTAPDDITVGASGLFTRVELGTPTASDGNDGEVTQFKAADNLTAAQLSALDTPVSGCQLFRDFEAEIGPLRPGRHVITWATCDSSGNSGRDEQVVNVKPLVSVTEGQLIGEGEQAVVKVMLNGDAPDYPASVELSLAGTATQYADYFGVDNTVTFNSPGEVVSVTVDIKNDAVSEGDETIVMTLHSPTNVALSTDRVHTITITESNVGPVASLSVAQPAALLAQDVNKGNTVYLADGLVQVTADAFDANGDTLGYDWTASDNSLMAIATVTDNVLEFDPALLVADKFYPVSVTVSDGSESVSIGRLLYVKTAESIILTNIEDIDGDGVPDDLDGFGDDDGDGIPNYLDFTGTPPNAIENQTNNLDTALYIETNPGLSIVKGEIAVASGASGVLIGLTDVRQHGGAGGAAVSNATTDYTFISSLLNFEIFGLNQQIETVDVVVPLSSAIQKGVILRKYNSSGWFDFVIDDLNLLSSADGSDGTCPPPGSKLYIEGLNTGDLCLQLTIQDGGANDADGVRNYVVVDPGGLALEPEPEEEEVSVDPNASASGRVGSISLWTVISLCGLYGWVHIRRRKERV